MEKDMATKLKTTDIKGKDYVEVHTRIAYFRQNYPDGCIVSEMISNENGVCIIQSSITVDGIVRATGIAYEKEGSSFINKTSHIENCETSAVGRALGIFGIGIEESVASAEEVGNAIKNQKKSNYEKQNGTDKDTITRGVDALEKCAKKKTKEDLEKAKEIALFADKNGTVLLYDKHAKLFPEQHEELFA
jgi:hypothetical protein